MLGMKIEDAYWTKEVNWLLIRCQCGKLFEHRADRRTAICPQCGYKKDTLILKSTPLPYGNRVKVK